MFDVRHAASFVCLLSILQMTVVSQTLEAGWKAGTARINITPAAAMPMAGYGSRGAKHSEGTLTDLWAKILVLEDSQGERAALITLDLVGIDAAFSAEICDKIQQNQSWRRDQIAICTSHTHTGPVVGRLLQTMHYSLFQESDRKLVDDYAALLSSNLVEGVNRAVRNLKSAELLQGSGRATFAVNRRENPETQISKIQASGMLRGPFDHDVPVLVVRSEGAVSAIVFGYACHNTTLSLMQWSGDYAGFAQIDLEQQFPGCQAMFWSGCGADQNPLPRKTVELAQKYGQELATAVDHVISGGLTLVTGDLQTRYGIVDVPLGTPPSGESIEADTKSANHFVAARARNLLAQIAEGRPLASSYPYPVQVWKLGDSITFIFLGGEVVVDYSLRLKDELGSRGTPAKIWCAAYSNDVMAYIPSRRVLLEGGYEGETSMVYYGLPTRWAPEIEDDIISLARKLVETP